MLVSVVIPTFNRARVLIGAVESVLGQTHRNLECLVVDDGSWDDTQKALAGVRDSRLKVLTQANRGVSAARNAGLAMAQGRILALLDSDDRFLPAKIERQLAFLLECGYDICQTQEIWIRNGRRVNAMAKHAKPSGTFFAQALETCLVSPSCVMFTRAFWDKLGGFDETLPACEDYDLWLRAMPEHPIGLLDQALTIKTGGSGDQLSRLYIGLDLFRLRALMKVLKRADLSLAWKTQAATALIRKATVYCRGCQKHGGLEEAGRVMAMVRAALAEQGFGTDFRNAPTEPRRED